MAGMDTCSIKSNFYQENITHSLASFEKKVCGLRGIFSPSLIGTEFEDGEKTGSIRKLDWFCFSEKIIMWEKDMAKQAELTVSAKGNVEPNV